MPPDSLAANWLAQPLRPAGGSADSAGKPRQPDSTVAEWRDWPEVPDFNGISAVVNLAGEPINQRWTADAKRRFYESRIGATGRIVRGLSMLGRMERPHVLVNSSAVGIYGERGDEILGRGRPIGTGYVAELCQALGGGRGWGRPRAPRGC